MMFLNFFYLCSEELWKATKTCFVNLKSHLSPHEWKATLPMNVWIRGNSAFFHGMKGWLSHRTQLQTTARPPYLLFFLPFLSHPGSEHQQEMYSKWPTPPSSRKDAKSTGWLQKTESHWWGQALFEGRLHHVSFSHPDYQYESTERAFVGVLFCKILPIIVSFWMFSMQPAVMREFLLHWELVRRNHPRRRLPLQYKICKRDLQALGMDLNRWETLTSEHSAWRQAVHHGPVSYTHLTLPTKA